MVGAFLGLSRERSDQRRFPAIHPLDSWSKYEGIIDSKKVAEARHILANGVDVNNMMKVVGEEGTSIDDFVIYLKSEYLDSVYLQQDAYNEIDAACSAERQKYVFDKVYTILKTPMKFSEKDVARTFFLKLTQSTKDWNRVKFDSQEHNVAYHRIERIAGSVITLRAEGVANQELAQVTSSFGTSLARVIRIDGDMVDLQVFAGARGISTDSEVRFLGEPMKVPYSEALLGRVFNGAGKPRDIRVSR